MAQRTPTKTRNMKPCPDCGRPISTRSKKCANCSGKGHTPEQRDQHALCGSKKRDGGTCRKFAGEGTEHFGYGRCRFHGGNSPNGKKNAVAIEAKQRVTALGKPLDVQPHQVLRWLMQATTGAAVWAYAEIQAMDDKELATHHGEVLLRIFHEEMANAGKYSEVLVRAGIAEKVVKADQQQIVNLQSALMAACTELKYTADQKRELGAALRTAIVELEADSTVLRYDQIFEGTVAGEKPH